MTKLTAYQRIEVLVDSGTFEEIGKVTTLDKQREDSVVTGFAKINGRMIFIIAVDMSKMGGSIGKLSAKKINHILESAVQYKAPIVALFESPGARIQEGVVAMHHIGDMFRRFAEVSGVVPTIAIQFGINSGATAYSAALMDFIIMVEDSTNAFITGPKVIEKMIGEKISADELGGTFVHGIITGLATFIEPHEQAAIVRAKQLLDYLPQHCYEIPEAIHAHQGKEKMTTDLMHIIPDDENKAYDMQLIINEIADDDSFLELQKSFAPNLIVGLAKLGNATIGIIANQPMCLSGILDVNASKKLFRFVQICDAYNIPLLLIADSPGFMPGKEQEHLSMIGIGARVLSILANSTIPKITLIVNKIIGGAYGGMSSKGLGADMVFVWPTAQIAVLGKEAALSIIYQKDMERAADKEKCKKEKIKEFEEKHLSPYPAAAYGQIDAIIHPSETRQTLMKAFITLQYKVGNSIKKRRSILPMG